MSILLWIITGIIAGWLAGLLARGRGFGIIGDLIVGLIGAFVGVWLAGLIGIHATSWIATVLVAAVGGAILVWILHLLRPGVA